jgi:glucose-6-phosphate isomerase
MISLETSGLPIWLSGDFNRLIMDDSLQSEKPQSRVFRESLPYYDTKVLDNLDRELYWMYRDVKKTSDESKIQDSLFRYDITVVLPGLIGDEYIKTIGHVHPLSVKSTLPYTYTEVYSVIYGTAHYVLQKYSEDFTQIHEVIDLVVNAGEHVLIPSFYGHVTVNVTNSPLVMANILYRDFASNYEPYKTHGGAAIYLKQNSHNTIFTEENKNYSYSPQPKKATAKDFPAPGLLNYQPLYAQWINRLNGFSYLYQKNEEE